MVRRDLVLANQTTGKVQRCILIDGTVRDAPVARLWVSSSYYTGDVDALCMSRPIYGIILGNIPCAREPSEPEKVWHSGFNNNRDKKVTETQRTEEGLLEASFSYSRMGDETLDTEDSVRLGKGNRTDQKFCIDIDSAQKHTSNARDPKLETEIKSVNADEGVGVDKISATEGPTVEDCCQSENEKIESDTGGIDKAVQSRGQELEDSKKLSALKVADNFKVNKDKFNSGERGGSVVECLIPEREVGGSKPTAAVLCP